MNRALGRMRESSHAMTGDPLRGIETIDPPSDLKCPKFSIGLAKNEQLQHFAICRSENEWLGLGVPRVAAGRTATARQSMSTPRAGKRIRHTGRTDFGKERADRYEVATRCAPNARAAEVTAMRAALHRLSVGNCQGIVDLGAGHAYLTVAILDFLAPNGVAFAVDNSPEMARRISPHRQIQPLVAKFDRLHIPSGSIDIVVSLAAFHHVTDKTLVLREVNRLLRPGGYVVIGDVNEGTPTQQFFDHVVREHCATGHDFDFLDRSWAAVIAERAGMQHISSSVENTDWRFDDEIRMLAYVANIFSLNLRPLQLRPFVERWLHPRFGTDGGSIVLPWSLGFHVFRKVERADCSIAFH